jgi:hypothetical protein
LPQGGEHRRQRLDGEHAVPQRVVGELPHPRLVDGHARRAASLPRLRVAGQIEDGAGEGRAGKAVDEHDMVGRQPRRLVTGAGGDHVVPAALLGDHDRIAPAPGPAVEPGGGLVADRGRRARVEHPHPEPCVPGDRVVAQDVDAGDRSPPTPGRHPPVSQLGAGPDRLGLRRGERPGLPLGENGDSLVNVDGSHAVQCEPGV